MHRLLQPAIQQGRGPRAFGTHQLVRPLPCERCRRDAGRGLRTQHVGQRAMRLDEDGAQEGRRMQPVPPQRRHEQGRDAMQARGILQHHLALRRDQQLKGRMHMRPAVACRPFEDRIAWPDHESHAPCLHSRPRRIPGA
ncbi:MAG: hypothetical protein EPO12_15000 [Aquabacterium sp.]|nr:MAG: hypothetical protein EPO12_15000 [Aquabacterium sp.]